MPIKPRTAEDAYIVARQDPRDMAKATLPEVQCPAVNGGPLATASKSQVDSSHAQADGLSDRSASPPAQWGRETQEGTASLTLQRVGCVNGGMAYGVRALGSRSCRSSRRTG